MSTTDFSESQHLYKNDFKINGIVNRNVYCIYSGAVQLNDNELERLSLAFMKMIDLDNWYDRLQFSWKIKCKELTDSVYFFMHSNLAAIVAMPEFIDLELDQVKHLLEMENSALKLPSELLHGIVRWMHSSVDEREIHLFDLMKIIQLKLGSVDETVLDKIFNHDNVINKNKDCKILYLNTVVASLKKKLSNQGSGESMHEAHTTSSQLLPRSTSDHVRGSEQNLDAMNVDVQTVCTMPQEKRVRRSGTAKSVRSLDLNHDNQAPTNKRSRYLRPLGISKNVKDLNTSSTLTAENLHAFNQLIREKKKSGKANQSINPQKVSNQERLRSLKCFYGISLDKLILPASQTESLLAYFLCGGERPALMSYNLAAPGQLQKLESLDIDAEVSLIHFSGEIYFLGGAYTTRLQDKCTPRVLNSVGKYDIISRRWTVCENMKEGRCHFQPTILNDSICAIAGCDYVYTAFQVKGIMNFAEMYNPVLDTWVPFLEHPNTLRSDFGMATVDNIVYMVGGFCVTADGDYNEKIHVTAIVEAFDPILGIWVSKSSLPIPLYGTSTAVANFHGSKNYLYAVGGAMTNKGERLKRAFVFCPEKNEWKELAPMCEARQFASSIVFGGFIYVVGGNGGSGKLPSIERYDIAHDAWEIFDDVHLPRKGIFKSMAFAHEGQK